MLNALETVNRLVWGAPAWIALLGVGLFLTLRLGFVQVRLFPRALKTFLGKEGRRPRKDGVSPFQALCTALAATVGTGNLAGVAGALALGGPGAIFWMWVCGFLGMATKFAEATLAVRYREKDARGEYVGGPMYMICQGMGPRWRPLALAYCFFGVVAAFGVGNATQVNAVIGSINQAAALFGMEERQSRNVLMGVALALLVFLSVIGGMKRIGSLAQALVPFASVGYLGLGLIALILRREAVLPALEAMVTGAFRPEALTGGAVGSLILTLRTGISRGVFTNEAGMGTAAMAHAAAQVEHPAQQGLLGIMEVFLDTIVICTMTALVILTSGVPIPYGQDVGVTLTSTAFCAVFGPWVSVAIAGALCCFAFATILGWGLYGARCAQFLFGENAWKAFSVLQALTVVLGAVLKTGTVWMLSETVNGLMAIPTLVVLCALSPELVRLTRSFRHAKSYSTL